LDRSWNFLLIPHRDLYSTLKLSLSGGRSGRNWRATIVCNIFAWIDQFICLISQNLQRENPDIEKWILLSRIVLEK